MHIIAIANQKGGVGKTTTAINLSAGLAYWSKRVLVVDMDPQGNATKGLGIQTDETYTVSDVLLGNQPIQKAIKNTKIGNLDILPADLSLSISEMKLPTLGAADFRLYNALKEIVKKKSYDYIIIDCPPTFGTLSVNSLVCAKHIIMPVNLEFFALDGISLFLDALEMINNNVAKTIEHRASILGVLLTFFDTRTKVSRKINDNLEKLLGDKIFKAKIPRNIKLMEAQTSGIPIYHHDQHCQGSLAYEHFVQEVLNRTGNS